MHSFLESSLNFTNSKNKYQFALLICSFTNVHTQPSLSQTYCIKLLGSCSARYLSNIYTTRYKQYDTSVSTETMKISKPSILGD
jgi:hypothetical protein